MTHHTNLNNDKQQNSAAKTAESFEKVAKDAGLKPEQALDYRQVDQGRNVEPKLESTVKPKNAKTGKGNKNKNNKGKGKKGIITVVNAEGKTVKEEKRDPENCGFCGNNLTNRHKNYHALDGVKLPKGLKSPPGAPAGKASGVFCDDCERASEDPTTYRDFRTAVVEREEDGTIENIPVTNLVAA